MKVIFGNYGKNTLALVQWAFEQQLEQVVVVNVDTGWAADVWIEHVVRAQGLVRQCGFTPVTLTPKKDFAQQVIDRGHFPSQKFQWCASFLKGLPFLEWLDEQDSASEAIIMLGSRRADSRARASLPEFIDESEHYGERQVWYPLFDHGDQERDALLYKTEFKHLPSRSLECQPCLHAGIDSLTALEQERLKKLESQIERKFNCQSNCNSIEQFDMGCGSPFVCGE